MQILTKAEVAILLKCEEKTVGHLVTSKQIPFLRIGKEVRFQIDSILNWIKDREIPPSFDSTQGI